MNGLYRLEAFGINNVWVRYRIAHGGLDEPELESKRERYRVFADDFGSIADENIALQFFHVDLEPPYMRRFHPGDRV